MRANTPGAARLLRKASPCPLLLLPGASGVGGVSAGTAADMRGCFARLRALVPTVPPGKRISKTELLQHVIDYIGDLQLALDGAPEPAGEPQQQQQQDEEEEEEEEEQEELQQRRRRRQRRDGGGGHPWGEMIPLPPPAVGSEHRRLPLVPINQATGVWAPTVTSSAAAAVRRASADVGVEFLHVDATIDKSPQL